MYSLGCWLVFYLHDTPSALSFLLSLLGSPELDDGDGFQRMSVPVWSGALLFGEFPPRGGVGGGKKKIGCGSKENLLFIWGRKRNSNPWWQTHAGWCLPVVTDSHKKPCKALQQPRSLRIFEVNCDRRQGRHHEFVLVEWFVSAVTASKFFSFTFFNIVQSP